MEAPASREKMANCKRQFYDTREGVSRKKSGKNILDEYFGTHKVFGMEIINEKLKETHRNWRNVGLGVRFKSCVTVQAPVQFGTHKNDSFQVFRIRNHQS